MYPQDRPVYKILNEKGFFGPDDNLYIEGEVIAFDDEPNEEMQPLNAKATERMTAYLNKLDTMAREAAEKKGVPFTSRAKTIDQALAEMSEDARRVQLTNNDGGVPMMGAKKRTESIQKIEREAPKATKGRGKLSIAQSA